MQTLETLKRRISSAQDLLSVVRTMKTLAAVSIRQYELAVESLVDYYQTVEDGLRMAMWNAESLPRSEAADGDGHRRTGAVIFGSDQGMCGQFNEQIAGYAADILRGEDDSSQTSSRPVIAVGGRVAGRLPELGLTPDEELMVAGSSTAIAASVHDLLAVMDNWRCTRKVGRILLFYNRRRTASSYQPGHVQLLPIHADVLSQLRPQRWPSRTLPAFTMDRSVLLSRLIRQYVFVSLFRAMAESLAGENASRIAGMQAAENNIQDRLTELQTDYHQQRQTAVTEELLDVVTGFEALKDDEEASNVLPAPAKVMPGF
ncbi:MAG: F0F1 ATP synthase subunit gamma [Planctomycetaceae bacterium]|nr:F0F1 ATP synthase subunit gamma [Planctomycetaceae bacterium]